MLRRIFALSLILAVTAGPLWAIQAKTGEAKPSGEAKSEKPKDVTEPKLIEKVAPKYPEGARQDKVQGAVRVNAVIGVKGEVIDVKAVESPDPRLAEAAIEAVKAWKFEPAKDKKGKPLETKVTLTINFRLK